jgi:hypothetical protein
VWLKLSDNRFSPFPVNANPMNTIQRRQVPISEALKMAVEHQRAQQIQQAEAIYRKVLAGSFLDQGAGRKTGGGKACTVCRAAP